MMNHRENDTTQENEGKQVQQELEEQLRAFGDTMSDAFAHGFEGRGMDIGDRAFDVGKAAVHAANYGISEAGKAMRQARDSYYQSQRQAHANGGTAGQSLPANGGAVAASEPVVRMQSRDYLDEEERVWLGGESGIALMSLDEPSRVQAIETNSYPFSTPMLSEDGDMLVYLSDADSTDVTDTEVRFSRSDGGGQFGIGTAIPDGADGFSGYGDSAPDFDGTGSFAGAVWLREAATLGLKAGTELNEGQQTILLNGLEVMASLWNGREWVTTRLTDNGSQEFDPVIAAADGKAIAVWRAVQTDESAFDFTQNRILCRIYDGTKWSDQTYTLYNGSAGEVTGMDAELLADGTAAVAFSVQNGGSSDIYYTLVDTAAENPEDAAVTIRATADGSRDEKPQLTTAGGQFVLGWSSVRTLTGAEQRDGRTHRILRTYG